MDSATYINALVAQYLSTVSSKLADKFQKEIKSISLPPDSPGLAEVVKHFQLTSPKLKRKLLKCENDSAMKKTKKNKKSDTAGDKKDGCPTGDHSSNNDGDQIAAKTKSTIAATSENKGSSSEDSSDEEKEINASGQAMTPKGSTKVKEDNNVEGEEVSQKKEDTEESSSGDSSDSHEEDEVSTVKAVVKEEVNCKLIKLAHGYGTNTQQTPVSCKLFVHGITEDVDNSDLKAAFDEYGSVTDAFNSGKGFAFVTFSNPVEATAAMGALNNSEVCSCQVTISFAKAKGSDTPGRGGRGAGRGGGAVGGRRQEGNGSKLFVHNVSEETSQEELWDAFGKHGTVTDAFNPGRGFAFITYSTPDEAQKAIAALDGKEVCGREIQCNIAKPKENKGNGGRGGRGGRGGGRGGRGGRGRGGKAGFSINVGAGGRNKKTSFD